MKQLATSETILETLKDYKHLNTSGVIEALEGFVEMRREIRKPMTLYAIKILIKRLNRLSKDPGDVVDILETSIMNSWMSVYPKRDDSDDYNGGVKAKAFF